MEKTGKGKYWLKGPEMRGRKMELCARGAALKAGIEEGSQLRARAEQVLWGRGERCTLRGIPQCPCSYSRAAGAHALPSVAATRIRILSHYSGIPCLETAVYKPTQLPHYTDITPMT